MNEEDVTFDTVQDMLELYKMPNSNRADFIKIIKMYLLDPINKKHKAGYITSNMHPFYHTLEKMIIH